MNNKTKGDLYEQFIFDLLLSKHNVENIPNNNVWLWENRKK